MSAGIEARLAAHATLVEAELDRLLRDQAVPPRLLAAMRHAALAGGKRLRPFLVHAASLGRAEPGAVLRVGAAIELLHSYSLVHDDLPAMDDAATRRGQPACHIAFDEATAILAGDALQARAFELLADPAWGGAPDLRSELCLGVARAAGAVGMCGGQMLDLAAEGQELDEAAIIRLQALKTGALIAFACDAGALLGGLAPEERRMVGAYAGALGLAFQIADDILDETATARDLGKPAGADAERGKATFVRLLGLEGARARLAQVVQQGQDALSGLGAGASLLREVMTFTVNRRA